MSADMRAAVALAVAGLVVCWWLRRRGIVREQCSWFEQQDEALLSSPWPMRHVVLHPRPYDWETMGDGHGTGDTSGLLLIPRSLTFVDVDGRSFEQRMRDSLMEAIAADRPGCFVRPPRIEYVD